MFIKHVDQLNDLVGRTIAHLDRQICDRHAGVLLRLLRLVVKRLVEPDYDPPVANVEHNDVWERRSRAGPDQQILWETIEPRIQLKAIYNESASVCHK